jgi:CMP-N-acetylneuraminic acid synthetase/spore coat polysaccharide biosynthesis predicted glycosyltransferase SpsG
MKKNNQKLIAIIPARGGSKGIPRKNLRPLCNKPLIYYSIKACLNSELIDEVLVSTEDDEIALLASRFGASVHFRPAELSNDMDTLDPVILEAFLSHEKSQNQFYCKVLTVQPTSPLLTSLDIDSAIRHFSKFENIHSLISVVDDRHLTWGRDDDGRPVALYKDRLNRQLLPKVYKETGAMVLCTREQLMSGSRIGDNIELFEMEKDRSFDIDSVTDLMLCESILEQKIIVFIVSGNSKIGLGHAFRALMLANQFVRHQIYFICDDASELAKKYINEYNYPVVLVSKELVIDELKKLKPDLIINDILDTELSFIKRQKSLGAKVVNFEDMGSGAMAADLVFNALYPQKTPSDHIYYGEDYFCLRDEFLYTETIEFSESVNNILISFGGVDPANLTLRVLSLINQLAVERSIEIVVIVGPGYRFLEGLLKWINGHNSKVKIVHNSKKISNFMQQSDLVFTSGGRTVYEIASMVKPMCVICQNTRELSHTFASPKNGVVNLGLHSEISDEEIRSKFCQLVDKPELRRMMVEKLKTHTFKEGKKRVTEMIENLMQEYDVV